MTLGTESALAADAVSGEGEAQAGHDHQVDELNRLAELGALRLEEVRETRTPGTMAGAVWMVIAVSPFTRSRAAWAGRRCRP